MNTASPSAEKRIPRGFRIRIREKDARRHRTGKPHQKEYSSDEMAYIYQILKDRIPEMFEAAGGKNLYGTEKRIESDYAAEVRFDPAVTGTGMQLQRVPYSLHPDTNLVALPLTKTQFDSFKLDETTIEAVYGLKLQNRGIPRYK